MPRRSRTTATLLAIAALAAAVAAQGPPGYSGRLGDVAEAFALAPDRAQVVAGLTPGTDDWFYWRCRERLEARDFATVRRLLPEWTRAHGQTARSIEIENREALLGYADDPERAFAFLTRRLDLKFDQTRTVPGAATELPTRLDPALLDPDALTRRALQERAGTVDGFTDRALPALAGGAIDADTLHSLLARLKRPDLPNLAALVVRDLDHPESKGFGSVPVHGELRREQLDECARLRPSLLQLHAFVHAMLVRLLPAGDAWQSDPAKRAAQLQRLAAFTERLAPSFNSLKAHVLFHWLAHDLAQGAPDRERFLAYIRLPRRSGFVAERHLQQNQSAAEFVANELAFPTGLPAIGDDTTLVRACLEHFFASEDDIAPFAEFLDAAWLQQVLAETALLLARGDAARWAAILAPADLAAIEQRVEITFPPTLPERTAPGDAVALDVTTKNVPVLLVRVFAIDTYRWHQETLREVDVSLDLDGVAPTHEETHRYDEPKIRRVRRHFELPLLQGPGTWIVEFVGNGVRCRAVVQKGGLRHTERVTAAGHVFRILDESGTALRDAVLWFGGREYTADERGIVLVPFSTEPGRHTVVLRHGTRSSLAAFAHVAESYSLHTHAFVDREALIAGAAAKVLVRPQLSVAGQPGSLKILQGVVLTITATDLDGRAVPQEVRDLSLRDDRELEHEITVPPRLQSLVVSLRGQVKDLSGKDVQVTSDTVVFAVNGMDTTPATSSTMLVRTPSSYAIEVRGKDGEVRAGRVCKVQLEHRDFTQRIATTLQTDERGRIDLGALGGIETVWISRDAEGFPSRLAPAAIGLPTVLQGRTGETLRIPWRGTAESPTRDEFSLLGNEHDEFRRLSLTNGFLELRDLPAGDYTLHLHATATVIPVRVIDGERRDGWIVGEERAMPASPTQPLHLRGVEVVGEDVVVRLANATADTRVHVTATRRLPSFDPFASLRGDATPLPENVDTRQRTNQYEGAHALGDEHRYVLERRFATKFAGNMLARPSLLLHPWAIDSTSTESEQLDTTTWNSAVGFGGGAGGRHRSSKREHGSDRSLGTVANLDWLPSPSTLLANLTPDREGVVRIPLASLGSNHLISVLAIDGDQAIQDTLVRDEQPLQPRSRRLPQALDSTQPFREQKRIEFVAAGEQVVLGDAAATQVEVFDSLARVVRAFTAIRPDPELAKFAFVLQWPTLTDARKRELHSQHACHELHFFLRQKDPAFFAAVCKPLLANKAHKTFLDHWLLDDDLSAFLEPWAFAQLNLIEKVLLAQRLDDGKRGGITRLVREQLDLQPVPVDVLDRLFDLAQTVLAFDEFDREDFFLGHGVVDLTGFAQGGTVPDDQSVVRRFASKDRDAPATKPGEPGGDPKKEQAKQVEQQKAEADSKESAFDSNAWGDLGDDAKRRGEARALFRAVDPTRLFVEHDYWHRRVEQMTADAVAPNRFWLDYATAPAGRPFAPASVLQATGSFLEMMMALAVLDLPFTAGKQEITKDGDRRTLRAATPLLLVRKEITKAEPAAADAPLLLGENFFRLDEPRRVVDGEPRDAFVTGEFVVDVAYGCRVVVTNPTSSRRTADLLLQVPAGAIPVQGGFWTKGVRVDLQPYATQTVEYAFYFPATGDLAHYPVHATEHGKVAARAEPRTLHVVAMPSTVDTASWGHVSQSGTADEVLAHLEGANVARLDLSRVAWRMKDRAFFTTLLGKLRERHAYDHTMWSFAILHQDPAAVREYLEHADAFVTACGGLLDSPLLSIDATERHTYQHLELDPLVQARAHRLGGRRVLGNHDLARQWAALTNVLGYRPQLDSQDWLVVTYYLLLQDRIEEALASFAKVDVARITTRLQYDYLHAYVCFFTGDTATARAIAERHRDDAAPHWQKRFAAVLAQLDEVDGTTGPAGEPTADSLAATAPSLELEGQGRRVLVRARNLERCEVAWFPVDVEFAFSAQPFASGGDAGRAFVRPAARTVQEVPANGELVLEPPADLRQRTVRVEVRGKGLVRSRTLLANALAVRFLESHGQVAVGEPDTQKPLPKIYVKVFAKLPNGAVRFHKDGYTDLRGRFDYASLSDDPNAGAVRYAVLVLDETRGAVIREVAPPAK